MDGEIATSDEDEDTAQDSPRPDEPMTPPRAVVAAESPKPTSAPQVIEIPETPCKAEPIEEDLGGFPEKGAEVATVEDGVEHAPKQAATGKDDDDKPEDKMTTSREQQVKEKQQRIDELKKQLAEAQKKETAMIL